MFSEFNMPSAKTIVSTAASVAASAMVVQSITHNLFPSSLQHYIFVSTKTFLQSFSPQITMIIEEFDGLAGNQIYKAAEIYLGTKTTSCTRTFRVSMPEKETKISTSMERNQGITDTFNGVPFNWRQVTREKESNHTDFLGQYKSTVRSEHRYFVLTFHKKHKDMVLDSYFSFILKESKCVKEEKKTLKMHTLQGEHLRRFTSDAWHSIKLDHPANFDTLAMDTELKKTIKEDLERFVRRREYYKRVGKAWKRGYLLYGPPGTGKSSLIAAMANFLHFDIYDLELTNIHHNSDLRSLLIATANRSILVVEDIDCSLAMQDRQANADLSNQANQVQNMNMNMLRLNRGQVTLSGLLNFIDGLWSSCGDERIIVFTTNHKDRIDPALLRPGRMDVHIHMSYCTPCGFRTLAANYLGVTSHLLFPEIEELMEKTTVTPAEVGEQLLKKEEPDAALQGLIEFLQEKKKESDQENKASEKQGGDEEK